MHIQIIYIKIYIDTYKYTCTRLIICTNSHLHTYTYTRSPIPILQTHAHRQTQPQQHPHAITLLQTVEQSRQKHTYIFARNQYTYFIPIY